MPPVGCADGRISEWHQMLWAMKAGFVVGVWFLAASLQAACTFGTSSETSLQGVFDSVLGPGSVSATNDCLASNLDQLWTAPGDVVATVLIEIAGFANQNEFGIYDPSAHTQRQVTVFSGPASSGASATLQLVSNGASYDVRVNGALQGQFATQNFGFFLHTPLNDTFFSQPGFNVDGADHLYSYRGQGQTFVSGPLGGTAFSDAMYLLAFEDLRIPGGDQDFQDFVATANFAPVPLPASIVLLGSILGIGGFMRRLTSSA
jgi:hypothetical protein